MMDHSSDGMLHRTTSQDIGPLQHYHQQQQANQQEASQAMTLQSLSSKAVGELQPGSNHIQGDYPRPAMVNRHHSAASASAAAGASERNVYVRNLSPKVSSEELRQLFSQYGEVESHKLMVDIKTGLSRGFGFVMFEQSRDAAAAVASLDGFDVHGQRLQVRLADLKTRPPGEPTKRLFLRNLPSTITNVEVAAMCAPFGQVETCVVRRDERHAQRCAGGGMSLVAHVEMRSVDQAQKVVDGLNNSTMYQPEVPEALLAKVVDHKSSDLFAFTQAPTCATTVQPILRPPPPANLATLHQMMPPSSFYHNGSLPSYDAATHRTTTSNNNVQQLPLSMFIDQQQQWNTPATTSEEPRRASTLPSSPFDARQVAAGLELLRQLAYQSVDQALASRVNGGSSSLPAHHHHQVAYAPAPAAAAIPFGSVVSLEGNRLSAAAWYASAMANPVSLNHSATAMSSHERQQSATYSTTGIAPMLSPSCPPPPSVFPLRPSTGEAIPPRW